MISVLNEISATHNSCEDSYFIRETEDHVCGGVFDGCSTGIKSHWASQTLAYAFQAVEYYPVSEKALTCVYLFLNNIKNSLSLTSDNFLSTCILFIYHKKTNTLAVRMFGDGCYFVNDVEYFVEQDNKPDYLGYHVFGEYNSFLEFIDKYPMKIYENVSNFKICSDGVKSINRSQFEESKGHDPMALLYAPPTSPNYLKRMWNILKKDKYTIADDLTIISYVQDKE